jgi:DNA-binding HxlR family transcriptional regulator
MSRLTPRSRRSPCPIACTLDVIGDRWSLLIIRDLYLGRSRFKELAGCPEGIATNLLSDRLSRLAESGIIESIPAADGSKHRAYALTAKGESLLPLLKAIRDWGLKWERGTKEMLRPKQ